MGQINISADAKLIADIDRLAAALGKSRPESIRIILNEAIDAHDSNRLAFARPEGPMLDASITSLVAQLREAVVELDRAQRSNQKVSKRLIDSWNGGEEAIQEADKRLTERVNHKLREAFAPFDGALARLATKIDALPQTSSNALEPHVSAIDKRLAKIHQLAAQPRQAHYLSLSDNCQIGTSVLGVIGGAVFLIGCVCGSYLSGPDVPVPADPVLAIVPTPASACRVVNYVFHAKDCRIPDAARQRAVDALRQEKRP